MRIPSRTTKTAVAGAVLLLAAAGAAQAQAPVVQKWVYSTGGDLSVTDGVNPATPITLVPGRAEAPDWSTDGTKIVFVQKSGSGAREKSKLWVVAPDGTGLRQLTFSSGYDVAPRWSPDGAKVVFQRKIGKRNSDIYVVNADGTGSRRLTRTVEGERDPAFSPDGTRIAFTRSSSSRPDYDLYVMNANGSKQRRLFRSPKLQWEPDWSPDGTRIAFAQESGRVPKRPRRGKIYNLDIWTATVTAKPVLTRVTTAPGDQYHPRWSPDGARIAYNNEVSGCPGAACNTDVFVVNADGVAPTALTTQAGTDWGADWGPLGVAATPNPAPAPVQ